MTLRVLVVEDDAFTRKLVKNALENLGFDIRSAATVRDALTEVAAFQPHAVVTDLDLGESASGIDLLNRLAEDAPWIGQVVLTAHASPELAAQGPLPSNAVYLVKSQVDELADIGSAVRRAIEGGQQGSPMASAAIEFFELSGSQAEVLRMMAEGLTNGSIAEARGTSRRAVENLVQRIFRALDLHREDGKSPRMEAVRLWRQGRVRVRG